jgi:hypothetical protein
LNRGSCRLNNDRASARGGVAPGVGGDVVDGVSCHLRRVDQNISRENAVDENPVGQIVALVVGHDCAKVGVGVADMDGRRIAALYVDRWGSKGSRN